MPSPRAKSRLALAGYLTLAAADTYLAGRPGTTARRARHVTKPLLMPTLAAATHFATPGQRDALTVGTKVAQAFSWGGDVALLGRGTRSFLSGVGSFAGAHLAYVSAFASARDDHASPTSAGPVTAASICATTGPVMAWAAGRTDPALRAPVAVYASLLAATFATSTVLDSDLPTRSRRTIVAGTSLLLLSDAILGAQRFLRKQPSPRMEVAVMATYTASQALIADGVVTAAGSRAPDRRPGWRSTSR